MDISITLDERLAIYAPVIAVVTMAIMKATPKWLDKERFGPIVSLGIGILVVIGVDALLKPFHIGEAVIKGCIVAAVTMGGYDTGKAGKAIIRNNGGDE